MVRLPLILFLSCVLWCSLRAGAAETSPPESVSPAELAHPVLINPRQVEERTRLCRRLAGEAVWSLNPGGTTQERLARLFLWFAADGAAVKSGRTYRLDLHQWHSPALQRLLRDVGLPLPVGYVFVREITGYAQMPPPVREAFERQPDVRAVTFFSRYIAVLDEGGRTLPASLREERRRQVLEHELVHVVVNSYLGVRAHELPLWFHEGCAVTFSGQPGSQTVGYLQEGPTGYRWVRQQWNLHETYRDYQEVFRYLAHQLGTDDFHAAVRRSLQHRSANALLDRVDAADYTALRRQTRRWQRRRENTWWALACLALAGLAFLYWRKLPRSRKPAPEEV